MRRLILCVCLASLWLIVAGCSRQIVLQVTEASGVGSSYECEEKSCEPASTSDPAAYSQSRTTFVALPRQCGTNGIGRILILNAGSKDPQVIVTCAAPSKSTPLGTMGQPKSN